VHCMVQKDYAKCLVSGHEDIGLDSITTCCYYLDEMFSAKKKLNRTVKNLKLSLSLIN
jgi:hypothetical protein